MLVAPDTDGVFCLYNYDNGYGYGEETSFVLSFPHEMSSRSRHSGHRRVCRAPPCASAGVAVGTSISAHKVAFVLFHKHRRRNGTLTMCSRCVVPRVWRIEKHRPKFR